jgi:hypothetical protein
VLKSFSNFVAEVICCCVMPGEPGNGILCNPSASFPFVPTAESLGGGCITRATLTTTAISLLLYLDFMPTGISMGNIIVPSACLKKFGLFVVFVFAGL